MLIDIAIIIFCALIGNVLFQKIGLPGILGMILTGIVLGPSYFDLINPEVHELLQEFKTVALIVILIRAGLGISKKTLNKIGGPAIRMGFVPGVFEGIAVTIASHFLLNLPIYEAGMLGFIIAAVSPAVVVPQMLELKESGVGKNKEVPTLVLAGASVDDVFAITIFGVFAGLAGGNSTNWLGLIISVPTGIALGAAIGVGIGYLLVWFFKKYHIRDTMKVIIFMIIAVVFYEVSESPGVKSFLPIAALLGIMAIGFVILEKYNVLAKRMASKFNKVWVLAEVLLFVYIGSEVKMSELNGNLIAVGMLILTVGLLFRSAGVWVSLLRSDLNNKERFFCMIAYIPKATVQAAMGAVPLTMMMDGKMGDMAMESGQTILAIAVLSIIVTAPIGAIGIRKTAPILLKQTK